MEDFELTLFDRLGVVRDTIAKHGGEGNFYVSFSGGKDSTIASRLLDEALPGNRIPRVYFDTGIEYNAIRAYVLALRESDDRFAIVKPSRPIAQMLREDGYPFKSKQHSLMLATYQNSGLTKSVKNYLRVSDGGKMQLQCPEMLKYQFTPSFSLKVSDKCCKNMKKRPALAYERESGRKVAITGIRKAEGGQRASIGGCVVFKGGALHRFHPLFVVSEEWEDWYVSTREIKLCELYYPPYNFKRTGCKGCPFNPELRRDLETMQRLLPGEYRQCWAIWGPVYEGYQRVGYRIEPYERGKLIYDD